MKTCELDKIPYFLAFYTLRTRFSTLTLQWTSQQNFVLVKTYYLFTVTIFCFPRRLEDIIARSLANTSCRTSWSLQEISENEKCYAEDVFRTSWKTRNVCWDCSSYMKTSQLNCSASKSINCFLYDGNIDHVNGLI